MKPERLAWLKEIVKVINEEAFVNIVFEERNGRMGVYMEPNTQKWRNLDGLNLLEQLSAILEVTKQDDTEEEDFGSATISGV